MQPASPSFPKVQTLRPRSLSVSLSLSLSLSLLTASTAGRSRFLRLALSERRKGGEIGGLDQKDQGRKGLGSTRCVRTWQSLAASEKK